VTVRVLVQLADKLRVEIASLASDGDERLSSELMEALSDPIFEEHDVKASDVRELVATLPSLGHALLALYRSHHHGAVATTDRAAGTLDAPSEPGLTGLPTEEVSDFMEQRLNHFEALETAAEELWRDNGISLHTLHHDLIRVLTQ
jgi:hypothetical protein